MQQNLQTADQIELWHRADSAVPRLSRPAGNDDTDRVDPGVHEHVKHRSSDSGEIDDELGMARQLCQEAADMGDDGGVRRTKR